ncbi:branched-chain amino acid transaminase [Mariniblastus fucicola]|uniref:Branched-chain-amino-acid aminotransferase n=1 Tax=Mariniblastus fucicola TaxID=980251 RepID=A0A5B9PHK1_9BACT|nr:branched-chain amino acid transaminase [Mariniblastus fucicola]QEG24142.1 Branched-chain-amino-acid aminotransferase [Mariniblastus fucicola]
MNKSKSIWMNGQLIPWDSANVHVMSHALHYGTSIFEGVRSYKTKDGRAIFRLDAHMKRFCESAKMYRIPLEQTQEELMQGCRDTIADNNLYNAYIRPLTFYGAGSLGVVPSADVPVETIIVAFEWGNYLGEEGMTKGIDVCVSSWSRTTSASIPVLAKAGGHYLNAMLIGGEARRHGYVEGISVTDKGTISEGSAENVFLIRDGVIYTPPLASAILGGITRASVMTLAKTMGLEVVEQALPRELMYTADEMFLTGTAAEVTPVRSVDGIEVGCGSRGPITEKLQSAFFGLFDGSTEDQWGWLDAVPVAVS